MADNANEQQEYQEYLDYLEYQKRLSGQAPAVAPQQRPVGGLEAFLRGTGQGVLPGAEANVAAQRASRELGDIGGARPELMSASEEAAMLASPELQAAQAQGTAERAQFGLPGAAGQVVGSAVGLPGQLASKAAAAVPTATATAPRYLKMASDVTKGAVAAPTSSVTMVAGEGELPSASELGWSAATGAAVPAVAHAGGMAKDTLANWLRGGAQKAAGFSDEMAATWAKDKELVKQLAKEKMHNPSALEARGKSLAERAIKQSQEKSRMLEAERGKLLAPINLRVKPEQFKGSAVEQEINRLAAAKPTMQQVQQLVPEENLGMVLQDVTESVPAQQVSLSGPTANRLKGIAQDAQKYREVYQQIGAADRQASQANRAAERSLRKGLEGASRSITGKDALKELNLRWGKQLADERAIKRMAQTNPSLLITSPTVKTQAVAQRMSPELRRAQEAYQTSKAILPEAGLMDELARASGRAGVSVLGPKTTIQDYTQLENLPSIVAAIEALKSRGKKE